MPLTTPAPSGCSVCRRVSEWKNSLQRKFQANQSYMGRLCQKKGKKWQNHVTDCSRSKFTPQSTPKEGRLAFLTVLKGVQLVSQVRAQCEPRVSSVNTEASTEGLWMTQGAQNRAGQRAWQALGALNLISIARGSLKKPQALHERTDRASERQEEQPPSSQLTHHIKSVSRLHTSLLRWQFL